MAVSKDIKPEAAAHGSCAAGGPDAKCAVVSWVMPSLAVLFLYFGLRYPTLAVFNLIVVAFGITAMMRTLGGIRRFGTCGLGRHVVAGIVLNIAIIALVVLYLFVGSDPLHIRP